MFSYCQLRCIIPPIVVVAFLFIGTASADKWVTPDGVASVEAPDSSRFTKLDSVPSMSVTWVSHDEAIKLGIVEISLPRAMELIRSSVEKGLCKEINGEIVESSSAQRGNSKMLTMTCRGEMFGGPVYVTQVVIAVGTKVYKAMAIGLDTDIRTDSDATKFITSFDIPSISTQPALSMPSDRTMERPTENDNESWTDTLSKRVGGISLLTLIVCAVVVIISRIRKP